MFNQKLQAPLRRRTPTSIKAMESTQHSTKAKKKEFRIRTVREVLEEVAKGEATKKQKQKKDEAKNQHENKTEATAPSFASACNDNNDDDESFLWYI